MELECVLTVSVSSLTVKSFGQVNDADGLERASLDALTATDTKGFRNVTDFASFSDFDALLVLLIQRTDLSAFLGALIWLALVGVDNGDSELAVTLHF